MKWRLMLWFAVLASVAGAVALGLEVIVAGVGKASGLAGVIVGFCELAALALGVAAWVGERRATTFNDDIPGGTALPRPPMDTGSTTSTETKGRSKYVVDARGAKALQIGDRNVQRNYFRGSPQDSERAEESDEC